MKAKALLCCLALIVGAMLSTNQVYSANQETTKTTKKSSPAKPAAKKAATISPEEMMAVYSKYGTPSEHHKHLAALEGSWDVAVKMWMTPDAPVSESKGVSENKLIFGGRYLQQEFTGEFMGKQFSGLGLTGYDNYKQKYVSAWLDSESTMLFHNEGTCDGTGKVITAYGKYDDPITNTAKKVKTILRIVDRNTHSFEWYEDGPDGKPFKSMEITYTRK